MTSFASKVHSAAYSLTRSTMDLPGIAPAAKLAAAFCLLVSIFFVRSYLGLALLALLQLLLLFASRISLRLYAPLVRPLVVITCISIVLNGLVLDGSGSIPLIGFCGITPQRLQQSMFALVRIYVLAGYFMLVFSTVTAVQIVDVIRTLLHPLERRRRGLADRGLADRRFLVNDIAMMLTIALRFLPLSIEQVNQLVLAQRSRGVRFEQKNLFKRLSTWLSVFIPAIVLLLQKADELGQAMQDRCYGAHEPSFVALRMRTRDILFLIVSAFFCVGAVLL